MMTIFDWIHTKQTFSEKTHSHTHPQTQHIHTNNSRILFFDFQCLITTKQPNISLYYIHKCILIHFLFEFKFSFSFRRLYNDAQTVLFLFPCDTICLSFISFPPTTINLIFLLLCLCNDAVVSVSDCQNNCYC